MEQQRALLLGLAFAGGALLPVQAIINGRLGSSLGAPFVASTCQNLVGAFVALVLAAFIGSSRVGLAQVAATPVWAWFGGALGMVYVLAGVVVAPRLGAASMMTSVIFGQLVSSLFLDQLGPIQDRRPIDGPAIVGAVLLLVGAILILRRA